MPHVNIEIDASGVVTMKARTFSDTQSNASKYHKMVGKALRKLFKAATIYQEYSMANGKSTNSISSKLHVDYFIPMYKLAIEIDGEHHYEVVDYGKKDINAFGRFENRFKLDNIKNDIAQDNGWKMVRIKYTDAGDIDKIRKIISEAIIT